MQIHLAHDTHWEQVGDTMVSGKAFLDDELYSNTRLANLIASTSHREELVSILERANGFFSVIHRIGDRTYAAVDHIRSWPLYYAVTDDIYLSDSAEWVHESGARGGYDQAAINEYLYLCYVTGKDTISKDVKQLRTGELLTFDHTDTSNQPTSDRYFVWEYTGNEESTSLESYEAQLTKGFERLFTYADGRTILLGMSSGFDSRLFALMLRKLGYDDTITYTTYTAADTDEDIPKAAELAAQLGFQHLPISSTHEDYHYLDNSGQRGMLEDIGYLSEYPHINKYILRKKLIEAGIDPGEVVHVLGHQMLNLGETLSDRYRGKKTITKDEFHDYLWNLHYAQWVGLEEDGIESAAKERMLDNLPGSFYQTSQTESLTGAMCGFGQWYWQERIPKFIHACREYEYLGFDMWYPLLDRETFAYYQDIGPEDIINRRILKQLVIELNEEVLGTTLKLKEDKHQPSPRKAAWNSIVHLVRQCPEPISGGFRRAYHTHLNSPSYTDDPRYGIIRREEFDSMEFYAINHRTLLLLYLYNRGYFSSPNESEFDRSTLTQLSDLPVVN